MSSIAPPRNPFAKPVEGLAVDFAPRKPRRVGAKIVYYGVEGIGKTSTWSHAPGAFIAMASRETGYDTLLANGLVPAVAAANVDTWDAAKQLPDLVTGKVSTFVCDSLSRYQDLLFEHVAKRDFKGDLGEHGFGAYSRGLKSSRLEWASWLAKLERLSLSGVDIVLLGHADSDLYNDPMAANYHRFSVNLDDDIASQTKQWATAVLFTNYQALVDVAGRDADKNIADARGKGVGRSQRVVYTQRRDAFDAKNQYDMPESITLPDNAKDAFAAIWQYIRKGDSK